jgi:hypothetical protein
MPKRTHTFSMRRIHDYFTFIIYDDKGDPWKAKKKSKTIQDKKRRKSRFPSVSSDSIKPEKLRYGKKWN